MKIRKYLCYAATQKEWCQKQGCDTHLLLFDIGQCFILHPSLLTLVAIHVCIALWLEQNCLLHYIDTDVYV